MVTLELLELAVDRAAVRYDRQGDQHYDVISAFIKSIRGSDVDAALHYLARMIAAGEDPRFIARRLVILASEDIGLADPTALTTAVAAAQAVQLIGMPEARLNLGPGRDRAGARAEVQRGDHGRRRSDRRRQRGQDRRRSRRICATPTTQVPRRSATVPATCTPTTTRAASPRNGTRPTRSPTASTTSRPAAAPRPSTPPGWHGSGRSWRTMTMDGSRYGGDAFSSAIRWHGLTRVELSTKEADVTAVLALVRLRRRPAS